MIVWAGVRHEKKHHAPDGYIIALTKRCTSDVQRYEYSLLDELQLRCKHIKGKEVD